MLPSLRIVPALLAGTLLAAPALADDLNLPARKPGQWEIKTEIRAGMPAMTTQLCLDAATDQAMMKTGIAAGQCSEMHVQQTGDGYTIDSVCQVGAATAKTHVAITGDFQSGYTMQVTSDRVGGTSQLPPHSSITQQATWKGPCAGGLQPGEMQMMNGMKVNVLKAMGGG